MKILKKSIFVLSLVALGLSAGIYISRHFFESQIQVGYVSRYPQLFMDKKIRVTGVVSQNKIGLGSWLKIYWLCDKNTGDCLPVKTNRSILPATAAPLTIKARLTEPFTTPWGRQLLLVEEEVGINLPLTK